MNYITSSNISFIYFAKVAIINFINIFSKDTKLHVQCLGKETLDSLTLLVQKYNASNIFLYYEDTDLNAVQNFNTPGFMTMVTKRWKFIMDIMLKEDGNFYFFDADVFFFKDPTSYILDKLKDYDILFQQDMPLVDGHKVGHIYACSGNFCFKKNQQVIDFFNIVMSKFNNRQNDQEVMYYYLSSVCKDNNIETYPFAKLSVLDPKLFQNGGDAFRANWYLNKDKICVHANHMIGINNKLNAFEKMGVNNIIKE